MRSYTTIAGDTFESIARKQYGVDLEASRIRNANPGAAEPLAAGITLVVPDLPGAPQNVPQQAASDSQSETAVLIDGERFRHWEQIRITRAIDAVDTLEMGAPLNILFRDIFRPFSYKSITVTVGGEPLFTGTMIGVTPMLEPARKSVSVSAYSLPGVLSDCTAPAAAFGSGGSELEFNNQTLQGIADKLAGFFGLAVIFDDDPGAPFARESIGAGGKVMAFLATLAKQRNLIISSSPRGELVFLRASEAGQPVARLQQSEFPLTAITPFFNPQEYYSHITGLEPVLVGLAGSQFTVKNPRLAGVMRPITFDADDVEGGDIKAAVEAKAGRMFGSAVSYSVDVPTWRDANGELWTPNTTVTVNAPDAMIYSDYAFTVRNIEFNREGSTETATLNLVLPGSFSGRIPETLPWD